MDPFVRSDPVFFAFSGSRYRLHTAKVVLSNRFGYDAFAGVVRTVSTSGPAWRDCHPTGHRPPSRLDSLANGSGVDSDNIVSVVRVLEWWRRR